MTETFVVGAIALIAFLTILQIFLLLHGRRERNPPGSADVLQTVQQAHDRLERLLRDEFALNREETSQSARQSREELASAVKALGDGIGQRLESLTSSTEQRLDAAAHAATTQLLSLRDITEQNATRLRDQAAASGRSLREELVRALTNFGDGITANVRMVSESNEQRVDGLRLTIERKLRDIQEDNAKQLDQMQTVVEEKLQGSLEKRLGESFRQVSDRLEAVSKGLGEMQVLATGVGDLKRVLANVKTRGTWGEVQLGAMLTEVLAPDQYTTNLATGQNGERVEFAIKLPGPGQRDDAPLWLPIDAKFPLEDYQRLIESQDRGDVEASDAAAKLLEMRIKQCAADISGKYVNPPVTTDFAILFLPTEGLFCEVVRRDGLPQSIQRDLRVVIAGPTTLWAILNSLQMGFRTLAIQKRSSEVWSLLAAVKTEWTKYGDVLAKIQKKLNDASNTVEEAARRTRVIGRKLRGVEELPANEADSFLMLAACSAEPSEQ